MFKKVLVGTLVALGLLFLLITALTITGLAVAGSVIGAALDNIVVETVDGAEVSDFELNGQDVVIRGNDGEVSVRVPDFSVSGSEGEIDFHLPEVIVRDEDGETVRFRTEGPGRIELPNVPRVRIDSRDFDWPTRTFNPLYQLVRGMIQLTALGLIVVGVWILVRRRSPAEKTPDTV